MLHFSSAVHTSTLTPGGTPFGSGCPADKRTTLAAFLPQAPQKNSALGLLLASVLSPAFFMSKSIPATAPTAIPTGGNCYASKGRRLGSSIRVQSRLNFGILPKRLCRMRFPQILMTGNMETLGPVPLPGSILHLHRVSGSCLLHLLLIAEGRSGP
jgi:hypothetical protein